MAQPNKQKKEVKTKQKKAEVAALIYNIADFGARKLSGIKTLQNDQRVNSPWSHNNPSCVYT